jgi:hypothetical protein
MIYWAKYLLFENLENGTLAGVKFSTDGSLIITHSDALSSEIILIFNATDGNIITSRFYSEGGYYNFD